jgi:type I restriction enzyme S subunit
MNKQTAQLLEQHFDTAFAEPDGIAKQTEMLNAVMARVGG